MKKKAKNKKKIVASIGLAAVAACCISAAPATGLANNSLYNDGVVRVYATEDQESIKTWEESIDALESGDISTYSKYISFVMSFKNAKNVYSKVSATITPEEQLVYDEARALVTIDADYYDYLTITLFNLKENANIKWSEKAEFDNQANRFAGLSAERQEWLKELIGVEYDGIISYANDEFARIQDALDAVEIAIDNIQYKGKVDSKSSLDAVGVAIKNVYGVEYTSISKTEVDAMAEYIGDGKLAMYDEALAEYKAIVAECEAFDTRIIDTYNDFTASGKYYTERLVIEALHRDYVFLNKGANDDRTTLITESAKIFELVASVKDVDMKVFNLQDLIREIPAEFDYTDAYIAKVVAAREYYDANIIADLKAVVEASDVDAGIQGYTFLCQTEAKIAECKKAVDDLIARAKNLQILLDENNPQFLKEVNAVVQARALLTYQKQKDDFNGECSDLLSQMRAKANNINATVTPVIEAIDGIGEVKLSDSGIAGRINNARTLYNALETELEKNSVSNYNKLVKAEEELAALTKEAADWQLAVEDIVIDGKITVDNIIAIDAVEATYKSWDTDLAQVVANGGSQFSYDKFTTLISNRNALLGSIATLATDMASISTDLEVISADPTVFTGAVEAAKIAFEALDTTVQAKYFIDDTAENKLAYDNYVAALNLYNNVYKLVGNIINLGNPTAVNMANYNDIYTYLDEYSKLSDENKAIVDNGGYKATLDSAKATVDALKTLRDEWIESVYALAGDVEKAKWADELYTVDLDAVARLKATRLTLDNTDNGLDVVDADFADIETIGNKRVNDMNNSIATLAAKQQLEKTDVSILESIYDIYNNKLHQTQKDLVDYSTFEVLYNKYVFAQNFDESVLALYEDVVINGNYTSETPITVGILRSIYINFGSEMKALIQEYARIDEIEIKYNEHVEQDGSALNLTAVYNELLSKINADGSNLATEISDLSKQVAEIEKAYVDADMALKDAITKAYESEDEALFEKITALQNNLAQLKTDLEKADSDIISDIANVREEIAEVKGDLEKLVADTKAELLAEIEALEKSLTEAKANLEKADTDNKAELQGKIDALTQSLAQLKTDLEKADSDIISDIANVREEIAEVKGDLEKLVADTKAELLEEIETLNKSLTTITTILSIVSGLTSIGVIILFVKKKKN